MPFWFGPSTILADTVLYVHPDHRGSSAIPRMLKKMEIWGAGLGAIRSTVGLSSGIDTERTACFFEKLKYTRTALLMQKEI